MLKIVDPEKGFVVCIDSIKKGLGGVLMHYGQVVFYELQKMSEHKKNYPTHDL